MSESFREQYYIAAITGQNIDAVDYAFMPNDIDNDICIYEETEDNNAHSDVKKPAYQVIVRNESKTTAKAYARLIEAATKEQNSLQDYYGMIITAAMNNTTSPVTFAPQDGSLNTKAAQFAVDDYILIDDEIMKVTEVVSPNVTASRAQLGTTIAAHLDNAPVYNISHDPIPGIKSNSINSVNPALVNMDQDDKKRHEYSVNYQVRTKLS